MSRTLASSLDWVEPHLPPLLVPPESLARIREVARLLPASAVDFFGFECRLGGAPGPTDCALNLTSEGARMLAGRSATPIPPELERGPWQRIRRFYQAWGDTRQPAYVDAGATWLEFDTEAPAPSPNLLFGYWPRRMGGQRTRAWLLDTILPLLLDAPLSSGLRASLVRCFDACPPETDDFQIGVMLSRGLHAVRLSVFDVPLANVRAFLDRIGWQGPWDRAHEYVEALAPHADFVGLALDVGDQIYPHLGVEPGFTAGPWAKQPHLEPRWHGQLQALTDLGLCTPAKRDALLSWVGFQRRPSGDPAEGEAVLLRGLSHVKITVRPGASPQAKAYFGIAQRGPSPGQGAPA